MGQQRFATGRRLIGVVVLAAATSVLALGPASAAPQTTPAPVRQLLAEAHQPVAKHASTGTRHALRLPGGDDDATFLGLDPRCAPGKGKAKLDGVVVSDVKAKLDWVLTGNGLRKTGTVKTKVDRPVSLKLPSVRTGTYRLTLALHGKVDLVAEETVDVLPCLVVKASCRAVTFTNPAGNPSAEVVYGGRKKHQQFDLELAGGASRTVRADYSKIDYESYADADTAGLGRGTVKVKQKCAHGPAQPGDLAVQTAGFAGCSASGAPATVTLGWSVQPSVAKPRYEVLDAGRTVVAQAAFKGGRDADVSLPAGSYRYRSYANGLAQPFEDVSFDVLDCVVVTPRCQAFEVENPNDVPLRVLAVSTDDEDAEIEGDGELTTLAAQATVTIPWTGSSAWVLALPEDEWEQSTAAFLSLASAVSDDGDPETVDVPQNC